LKCQAQRCPEDPVHGTNKANSRRAGESAWAPGPWGRASAADRRRETNPISRRRAGTGEVAPVGGMGPKRAKQSQWGSGPDEGQVLCPEGVRVNGARQGAGQKQSQSPVGWGLTTETQRSQSQAFNLSMQPVFHHSSIPIRWRAVQTNPIPGGPAGIRGPIVRNKANPHRYADPEIGVPGGRLCQTNPISGGWAWTAYPGTLQTHVVRERMVLGYELANLAFCRYSSAHAPYVHARSTATRQSQSMTG
jgi:hypothetical protein